MKPTIKMNQAFMFGNRLVGTVKTHPLYGDGEREVITSPVKQQQGNTIETENTIYEVESWAEAV